jgi:glycine/serine hydroxymethyltransferase
VPEITRRAMKEKKIVHVGNLICRILVDKEGTKAVREEFSDFMKKYQKVRYCFDWQLNVDL